MKVLEDQLEEVQAVSARLRERVDRAEPEVEDLNAKVNFSDALEVLCGDSLPIRNAIRGVDEMFQSLT